MDSELTDKLLNDFPKLFCGRKTTRTKPIRCFGFECSDGWFQIIYDLSADLIRISQEKGCRPPIVVQVKEKFGGLRFYIEGSNNEYQERISIAESLSHQTCEVCGRKGQTRRGGWIQTLCDKHAKGEL